MITIHNINEHTLQEVYDQIALHLLTQGKQCINNGLCRFRNLSEESACSLGHLIPLSEYTEDLELSVFGDILLDFGIVLSDDLVRLLEMLRVLHDDYQPSEWPILLHDIAEKMNLSSEVVSCFTH